jgi:hypothetical protein
LPGFGVEGGKADFRESWGMKSRLFPCFYSSLGPCFGPDLEYHNPQGYIHIHSFFIFIFAKNSFFIYYTWKAKFCFLTK